MEPVLSFGRMRFYFATSSLSEAEVVILGLPLDRTSSFLPGTRFGPEFARVATQNVESYSPYQGRDLSELMICDLGDLELSFEAPDTPFSQIEGRVRGFAQQPVWPVLLGGEHTITLPIVRALSEAYPDLCVLSLDAHLDLRDSYLGERVCHSTVMRRVQELVGPGRLFSVGARSFTSEEASAAQNLYPFEVYSHIPDLVSRLKGLPCYLSLDLDLLNPAEFPAVSAPVPGGISYQGLLKTIGELSQLSWVGIDLVEYNPMASGWLGSGVVVAELLRELILALFPNRR